MRGGEPTDLSAAIFVFDRQMAHRNWEAADADLDLMKREENEDIVAREVQLYAKRKRGKANRSRAASAFRRLDDLGHHLEPAVANRCRGAGGSTLGRGDRPGG